MFIAVANEECTAISWFFLEVEAEAYVAKYYRFTRSESDPKERVNLWQMPPRHSS